MEAIELDIFYDYTCPFVYRAAETIELVRASGQRQVRVNWRYFSLVQVNSREPSWSVWEASGAQAVHGRLAFASAEAARRQGGFDRFHLALLRARHRDGRDIDDVRVVEEVATQAGLDLRRFRDDIAAGDVLEQLKRDHTAARDRHGVFGTPTFLFPSGAAAYVRLAQVPDAKDVIRVFDHVLSIAAGERSILEIKRPVGPASV